MSEPERLILNPRTVDAVELATITGLVQAHQTGMVGALESAWARFQAASVNDGALARIGGIINGALDKPAMPVDTLGLYQPGESRVTTLTPGRVACLPFDVAVPGQVLASFAEFGSQPAQYAGNISVTQGRQSPDLDAGGTSVRMIRELAPGRYFMHGWLAAGFPATQIRMYISLPA